MAQELNCRQDGGEDGISVASVSCAGDLSTAALPNSVPEIVS